MIIVASVVVIGGVVLFFVLNKGVTVQNQLQLTKVVSLIKDQIKRLFSKN